MLQLQSIHIESVTRAIKSKPFQARFILRNKITSICSFERADGSAARNACAVPTYFTVNLIVDVSAFHFQRTVVVKVAPVASFNAVVVVVFGFAFIVGKSPDMPTVRFVL